MAQCKSCGKKGLLLRLEKETGLCISCKAAFAEKAKPLAEHLMDVENMNLASKSDDPNAVVAQCEALEESANKLIGEKLESMKSTGADCIAVICPQCFYQFDTGQLLAFRSLQFDFNLPVFFYLQLLALAEGYSLDDLGYKNHRVKNSSLEKKLRGL